MYFMYVFLLCAFVCVCVFTYMYVCMSKLLLLLLCSQDSMDLNTVQDINAHAFLILSHKESTMVS